MLSFPFWSRRSLPEKSDKITAGTLGEAAERYFPRFFLLEFDVELPFGVDGIGDHALHIV